MKRLVGQAGRAATIIIHRTGMIVMTIFFLAVLAIGALAYRLSLGPLEIPGAATRLANAVSGEDVVIHIGQAELAWAGYKKGSHAPLFLKLGRIAVHNTSGALLATIPQAQLVFSLSAFFNHRAPIYVASQNALIMGSNAPVSLLAGIRLGTAFTLQSADIWVTLGAGQIGPPGLDEQLVGGKFQLNITPTDVRLSDAALILAPYGQSAPVVHIDASAHRSDAWHGAVTLNAAAVQAQDLYHYWPAKLVPMTRGWVTSNIIAGWARNARFTLGLTAPLHLANVQVTSAAGGFDADDATLIWLSGVQPLTGLMGKFALTDLDNIYITATTGHLGGITLSNATMHIAGVSKRDQLATLNIPVSGTVQATFAALNGPGLGLMKSVPAPVPSATGDMAGTVQVVLPLQKVVSNADVKMTVATVLTNVTLPLPAHGLTLTDGRLNVDATLQNLRIKGDAMLSGEPASLTSTANFGAAAPVTFDMKTIATAQTLHDIGWNPGSYVEGPMPVHVHVTTDAANNGSMTVTADLTQTAMALPVFGWSKPAGAPGSFSFAAGMSGNQFSGISRINRIDAKAPGLNLQTTTSANAINLNYVRIGNTQGSGRIVFPQNPKLPWIITLTGNALDLSSVVNPPHASATSAKADAGKPKPHHKLGRPAAPTGFLWNATAHFDRLVLADSPEPELTDFNFSGNGQGNSPFRVQTTADVENGKPVTLTITPQPGAPGDAETMQLQTGDGGQLLRATGAFDDLKGGVLDLSATYGVAVQTAGVTKITQFRLLKAPALGKFLQAITVLGIPEAASGPGLLFNRLVVPFSIDDGVMTLKDARAYSAALGFTASGTVDLNASLYNIHGTVVPAYALNALPGKIPLIGKLFSPEKGGGLFAMRYSMTGPMADPKVRVNPLSAITPGFLREIFGIGKALVGAKAQ